MAVLSKNNFDLLGRKYGFCTILHEGLNNCFYSQMMQMPTVAVGSAKFFLAMYAAQRFLEFRKIKKSEIIPLLISFLRSVVFTTCYQNLFFLGTCYGVRIMGPVHVIAFLSPFLSGLSSFVDDPKRRVIVSTTFTALAIEAILRRLYFSGIINRSKMFETLAFMFLNAYTMYNTTRNTRKQDKLREIWFFKPGRHPTDHSSVKFILKETLKFASIGCLFSLMKVLSSRRKSHFISELLAWKSLKIPATVGSYVFLYYVISHLLSKLKNKENITDDITIPVVSGIVAGSSYYINPNMTVLSTLALQVLKDFGHKTAQNLGLSNGYPYWEMTFIAANAVLLNTRIFQEDACPKAFNKMINYCTGNRVDALIRKIHQLK